MISELTGPVVVGSRIPCTGDHQSAGLARRLVVHASKLLRFIAASDDSVGDGNPFWPPLYVVEELPNGSIDAVISTDAS